MRRILAFALCLLIATPVYAGKDYAKRFPTDTALEVYTPNNPPPTPTPADPFMANNFAVNAQGGKYYTSPTRAPIPTGWTRAKKITLPTPTADLTNFTIFMNFSDTGIGGVARSDGYDIRFLASDGTTYLSYERGWFDIVTGTARGKFWVKVPSISATNTSTNFIWIIYGNPAATDGEDRANAWDDYFTAVYAWGGYSPTFSGVNPLIQFAAFNAQVKRDSKGINHAVAGSTNLANGFGAYPANNCLTIYTQTGYQNWWKFTDNNLPTGASARTYESYTTSSVNAKLFSHGTYASGQVMNIQRDSYNIGDGVSRTYGGTGSNYNAVTYDGSRFRATKDAVTFATETVTPDTTNGGFAYMGSDVQYPTTNTSYYGNNVMVRVSNVERSDAWLKYTKDQYALYSTTQNLTWSVELYAMSFTDGWLGTNSATGYLEMVANSVLGMVFNGTTWAFLYPVSVAGTLTATTVNATTITASGTITGGHLKDSSIATNRMVQTTTGGQLADSGVYLNSATWVFPNITATGALRGNNLTVDNFGAGYIPYTTSGGYFNASGNLTFDNAKMTVFLPSGGTPIDGGLTIGSPLVCSGDATACGLISYETCTGQVGCSQFDCTTLGASHNDCASHADCVYDAATCNAYTNYEDCGTGGCTWDYYCSSWSADYAQCSDRPYCTWGSEDCSIYYDVSNPYTCEQYGSQNSVDPLGGCTLNYSDCSVVSDQSSCDYSTGGACYWSYGTDCAGLYTYEDCNLYPSECTWNTPCAQYTDSSSCSMASCTWNATTCVGVDEATCTTETGCSPSYANDCNDFDADEASCLSHVNYCSATYGNDCSTATYPDCTAFTGCVDEGTYCSGYYFSDCSGTYYDSCSGEYNGSCTGQENCSGYYGAGCLSYGNQWYSSCTGSHSTGSCTGEGCDGGTCTGTVCEGTSSACNTLTSAEACGDQDGCSATVGQSLKLYGGAQPAHMTDAAAPNDSVYYSTTQNKICYKDESGNSNALY